MNCRLNTIPFYGLSCSCWDGCRSSCLRQICVLLKRPAAANNYKRQRTVSESLFFFSLAAVCARKFDYKCNAEKCRGYNVRIGKVTSKTFGQPDAVGEPRTRRGTQTLLYYLWRLADDSYLRRSVRSVFSLTSALMHSNVAHSLVRTWAEAQCYICLFLPSHSVKKCSHSICITPVFSTVPVLGLHFEKGSYSDPSATTFLL